jgi:hypothetical protein
MLRHGWEKSEEYGVFGFAAHVAVRKRWRHRTPNASRSPARFRRWLQTLRAALASRPSGFVRKKVTPTARRRSRPATALLRLPGGGGLRGGLGRGFVLLEAPATPDQSLPTRRRCSAGSSGRPETPHLQVSRSRRGLRASSTSGRRRSSRTITDLLLAQLRGEEARQVFREVVDIEVTVRPMPVGSLKRLVIWLAILANTFGNDLRAGK